MEWKKIEIEVELCEAKKRKRIEDNECCWCKKNSNVVLEDSFRTERRRETLEKNTAVEPDFDTERL